MTDQRILMIGLDAAEPALIEKWIDDGTLPNLRSLRGQGAYGRLSSSAEQIVGSPWPTFYTGIHPGDHGFFHYLGWDARRMVAARPTPDTIPLTPFWRPLAQQGVPVIAVDVPLTYHPDPYDGTEVLGWATHETLVEPGSHPSSLWRTVVRKFGPPPVGPENYILETPSNLLRLRDQLNHASERVGDLAGWLMQEHPWRLCLVGFCAAHRGGHKLWDETNLVDGATAAERTELADALRQVYIGCDRAVGRLVEQAGPDATVIVFSLHGMGPNTCRTEMLGEMLGRVLGERPIPEDHEAASSKSPGGSGLTDRLRDLLPASLRHAVKSRLPLAAQDWLTAFWRLRGTNWKHTRAISLPADVQGYIRVNLKGRESRGIVEAGAPFDALCAEIQTGLRSFCDQDTGRPVVADVLRTDQLYGDGERRAGLPDLLVHWTGEPVAHTRRIASPDFGAVDWPTPGKNVTGRSGNHRGQGFALARGACFSAGGDIEGGDILDLVPTVCRLLGRPPPWPMRGRPLTPPDAR